VGAAAAVVIAAAIVLGVSGSDPRGSASHRPPVAEPAGTLHPLARVSSGVTLLDAASGRVRAVVPPLVVRRPVAASPAGGRFWVFDAAGPTLDVVDVRSGEVRQSVPSPVADIGSLLPDGENVWVSDERTGRVTLVDGRTGAIERSFGHLPGSGGSVGLALSNGVLWIARPQALGGTGMLIGVDPRSGHVERVIRGLLGSYQLAESPDGGFWTAGTFGSVNYLDPGRGMRVHGETSGRNFSIATDGRHAWTADSTRGIVYQIDGRGAVDETYQTAPGARAVAYADGAVWVGNGRDGSVTRITTGGRVDVWRFDHRVVSLAAADGVVLVEFGDTSRG
jgi:DNA-binding beta-propeller fold protein YncE